jgi:hypothetical protein
MELGLHIADFTWSGFGSGSHSARAAMLTPTTI